MMVQSLFRGHTLRKRLRIQFAAQRITKFIRLVGDMKRRDIIYTVKEIKKMVYKKIAMTVQIQRIVRGGLAR